LESKAKNLVVILGPTAVGKSATAIRLAKRFKGEIINCDSMQVYRGFDIGTDKIPLEERENIPHHILGIVDPTIQFTAADFVKHAIKAIEEIQKRRNLPFITGGTGLYLKALLDGLFPEGEKNPYIRKKLEQEVQDKGLEHMREKLLEVDPIYGQKAGKKDKIRIIRALEVFLTTKKPLSEHFAHTHSFVQDFNVIKIGLKLERSILYKRIEDRVDRMFEKGIVKEAQELRKQGIDVTSPPFRALGFKQVLKHLNGEMTYEEAIEATKKETRHYAKRQMTWFRRMEGILWFSPDEFPSISRSVEDNLR
jgi:tRNA dimethylallyltransferase